MVIAATEVNLPPGAQHNFARGTPMLVPGDNTHLRIAVAPLPQGIYAVEWRVLSRDGHSAPGQFNFRVIDGRKLSS
jgi:methionine-rich copper-binding protein CopC